MVRLVRDCSKCAARPCLFQARTRYVASTGLKHRDIHRRKRLKKSQHILDYMDGEDLGANKFRATLAEAKLRREGIQGK